MEQHRTHAPQYRPRRGTPVPAQAGRATADGVRRGSPAVRKPAGTGARTARRLPNPRLTGLGSGLFCGASMFVLACLDQLLLGGSQAVYGVLFLPVCLLTALWVRPGDLVTAPVVAPIAFTLGLLPVADAGDGGISGRFMGLVTALALQAGWLYGGTLVAGLVVLVRRVRLMARRAARRRALTAAAQAGQPSKKEKAGEAEAPAPRGSGPQVGRQAR
ncbi:DUF6542 domain-containing protein [Streptomyces sp. NPDC007084]|uniref:DUF6542 domain-containing protein n=1 Tax=Streptomyces sp. NPDC007084 TaxID=3154313 RepID=UPI003451124E